MNTKLHAIADANRRPLSFLITAGQASDYTGAAALLDDMSKAQWLLGDRSYDADWFRGALQAKGIQPCILGRKSRNEPVRYDRRRYRPPLPASQPHRDQARPSQGLVVRRY